MRAGGEDVHAAVLIDVEDVHETEFDAASRGRRGAAGCDRVLLPVGGVKLPLARGAHIGGRFQPAFGREDVVAPVAIDIAHTDAVAVALPADDVLHPLAVLQFEPGQRNIGAVELGEQLLRLAVIIEVHQEGEFRGTAGIDFVDRPRAAALPRILQPDDLRREITELHDVHPAVAIHVDGDIGEVVDVVGVEVDLRGADASSTLGASYQFSPEMMSGRPSLLRSATATVSLAPGSIMRTWKGMSGGRLDAASRMAAPTGSNGVRTAGRQSKHKVCLVFDWRSVTPGARARRV